MGGEKQWERKIREKKERIKNPKNNLKKS